MVRVRISDLDLGKVAESGQCFRMEVRGSRCALVARGRYLAVEAEGDGWFSLSCGEAEYRALWGPYFDADTDYGRFIAAIPPEDAFLTAAAAFSRGVRILRQDPWETLVTFQLSQRKNIPAIRRCVETLCSRFGTPVAGAPRPCFAFPTPEALAACGEEALRACGLGYRAPYVLAAARMAAEGRLDWAALGRASDEALLEVLLAVPGVGVKVANCVRLFGFHRLGAFPRDVWVRRVEEAVYNGRFPDERYPGFAGVLQQYLFYYGRSGGAAAWTQAER